MSQDPPEVFSKDTFLTSIRENSAAERGILHDSTIDEDARIIIEEPVAMAMVREKHAQLHEVVASLSDKIGVVLSRQENDFLAAYRAHMYNLQKELHTMRDKLQKNETIENKTEKIKKVEEERDWYRKEALRLDEFTSSMTKDLQLMKEKLEAIEEDRNWLEKQLKACKKQNKLLRADLDLRGNMQNPPNSPMTTLHSPPSSKQQVLPNSTSVPDASSGLPRLSFEALSPNRRALENDEKYKKQLKLLKKELHAVTQELATIKRQRLLEMNGIQVPHLEQFFLQCVNSVKAEVQKRQAQIKLHECGYNQQQGYRVPSMRATITRNQKLGIAEEFQAFESADRVRVIERLLAHDEVLTFIYHHLFPNSVVDTNTSHLSSLSPHKKKLFTKTPTKPAATAIGTNSPILVSKSSSSIEIATGQVVKMEDAYNIIKPQPVGSGAAVASAARGNNIYLGDPASDKFCASN